MDLSPFRVHCGSGLPAHPRPLSRPGVVSAPAGRREEDSDGSTRTCERRCTGQWDNGPGGRRGRVTPGLDSKYRHGGIPAILLHLIPSCVSFPPLPAPHPLLPITLRCTHPREGPSPCQASEAGKGRTEACGPPALGPYLSPAHWGPSVPWSSWVSLVSPVLPAIPPSSGSPGPPGFPCPLDHLGSPHPGVPWLPKCPSPSPGSLLQG